MLAGSRERRPDGDGAACRSDRLQLDTFYLLTRAVEKRFLTWSVSLPSRRFVSDPRRSSACIIRVNLKTFCIHV